MLHATWLVPRETAAILVQVLYTLYNHAPVFIQSHIYVGCIHVWFICNLLPLLSAEGLGSFTCYYSNTGIGTDTELRLESAQKADCGEENAPAPPAWYLNQRVLIMSPSLYHWAVLAPPLAVTHLVALWPQRLTKKQNNKTGRWLICFCLKSVSVYWLTEIYFSTDFLWVLCLHWNDSPEIEACLLTFVKLKGDFLDLITRLKTNLWWNDHLQSAHLSAILLDHISVFQTADGLHWNVSHTQP